MCLHTYLIHKANLVTSKETNKNQDKVFQIDRNGTVDIVIRNVIQSVPKAMEDPSRYLMLNQDFLADLREAISTTL